MISKITLLSLALLGCWMVSTNGQTQPQGHPGHGRRGGFLFGRKGGRGSSKGQSRGGSGSRGGLLGGLVGSRGGSRGGLRGGGEVRLKLRVSTIEREIGQRISRSMVADMRDGDFDGFIDMVCDREDDCTDLIGILEDQQFPEDVCLELETCCGLGGERSGSRGGSGGLGSLWRGKGSNRGGRSRKGKGGKSRKRKGGKSRKSRGGKSRKSKGSGSSGSSEGSGGRGGSGGSGRAKLGTSKLLGEFEGIIGRKVPSSVKISLIMGRYSALWSWLRSQRITISQSEYELMIRRMEEEELPDDLIEGFEEWYEEDGNGGGGTDETDSGTDETDTGTDEFGGGEDASWESVKLTNIQITRLERSLNIRLPSSVKREMRAGNFLAFSQWMEEERMTISGRQWTTLKRSVRLSRTDEAKLETWFRVTGGSGGNGGGGGGSGGGQGGAGGWAELELSETEIDEFETAVGRSIPSSVRREMRSGNFRAFSVWMEENNYTITSSRWRRLQRRFRGSKLTTINEWYKVTGGRGGDGGEGSEETDTDETDTDTDKTDTDTDETDTDTDETDSGTDETDTETDESGGSGDASWKRVKLTNAQITRLERSLNIRLPTTVKREMEAGNFLSFSEWMEQQRITISGSQWESLKRSVRLSRTDEASLETWFRVTGGRGGNGGGGGGSGGISDNTIEEIESTLGTGMPGWVTRNLKEGKFESFTTWAKRRNFKMSRSKITRVARIFEGAGASSSILEEIDGFEEEEGEETDTETEEDGDEWEQIDLTEAEIDALENAAGESIPSEVRSRMRSGDFEAFSVWMQENRISIRGAKWRRLKRSFRGVSLTKLNLWYKATNGRGGGGRGGGGNNGGSGASGEGRISAEQIVLFRGLTGEEMPDSIQEAWASGDEDAVLEWLESGEFEISASQWNTFRRGYSRAGIRKALYRKINQWYKNRGSGSNSGSSRTKNKSKMRGVFGRFSNKIWRDMQREDAASLIQWLTRRNSKPTAAKWAEFERSYQSWGFSSTFYTTMKVWYEGGGDGDDCGRPVPNAIQSAIRQAYGGELPDEMEENMDCGRIDEVLDFMDDNEISLSATVTTQISAWQRG